MEIVDLRRIEWRCRLRQRFFGLDDKYIESVYEEFFILKYHGGWSYVEAYNLPIPIRRWFLEKLVKQMEMESKAIEEASKGNKQRR